MDAEKIGSYEIQARLGSGDLGVVYRVRQPRLKRSVVIKQLRQICPEEAFAHFQDQVRRLDELNQPGNIKFTEWGQHQGQNYWVMPWMEGGSLAERIQRDKLSPDDALRILRRLAPALDAAHREGILHGDIKPSNILFDADGEAFLADFGMALLAEGSIPQGATALVGPPAYLSPEQAQGIENLDGRSDLYMLAVVLFQALTGSLPFEGPSPLSFAVRQVTDQVPDVLALRPDLPPTWGATLQIMLGKDPQMRFGTLSEVTQVLEAGWTAEAQTVATAPIRLPTETQLGEAQPPAEPVTGLPATLRTPPLAVEPQPAESMPVPRRKPRSWGWVWAVIGMLLLLALGGYGWYTYRQADIDLPAAIGWAQSLLTPAPAALAEADTATLTLPPPSSTPTRPAAAPSTPMPKPTLEGQAIPRETQPPSPTVQPTAAATAAPTQPPTPLVQLSYSPPLSYTIQYNDTLFAIASQFHVDVGELISINDMRCDSRLPPSVRLVIPPSYQYTLPTYTTVTQDSLSQLGLLHVGNCLDKVSVVEFSPDNRILATASGNFVYLWQVGDWKPLARLKGHTSKVTSLAFSDNGQTILTGSDDTTVRLWQVSDGALLTTFKGHFNAVTDVAFFPGSQTLVSTSRDQTVRIWSVDGSELKALRGYPAFSAAIAPDGQTLAVGYADSVRIWLISDFSLVRQIASDVVVRHLAYSPDGQMLVSNMYAWQVADGRKIYTFGSDGDTVSFTQDGQVLAVGRRMFAIANGGGVRTFKSPVPESPRTNDVWDATTFSPDSSLFAWGSPDGLFVFSLPRDYTAPAVRGQPEHIVQAGDNFINIANQYQTYLTTLLSENELTCASLPFLGQHLIVPAADNSPVERSLAPLSLLNALRIGELRQLEMQCVLTPGEIHFGPDSQTLAAGSALWRLSTGSVVVQAEDVPREFDGSPKTDLPSPVLLLSPDGQTLAVRQGSQIQLWNVADGRLLRTLVGHTGTVTSLVFSFDGQTLISGSGPDEQIARLWTVADGSQIGTIDGFTIQRMQFVPPDGEFLLVEGDSAVRIWRMSDRYLLHNIQGVEGRVAVSPDGAWLAFPSCQKRVGTTCQSEVVSIYRIKDGELSVTFQAMTDQIQDIRFSPDGQTLAVASGYGILLHQVGEWHQFIKLIVRNNLSIINKVTFSSDSSVLLTHGEDNAARLWDVSTGNLLYTMDGAYWKDFAFSPDGTMLAVWTSRGISIWGVEP